MLRAAQYVRMSTEHQQYSTENQERKIAEYAAQRGLNIVRTYSDGGRSGLQLTGRKGLQQLLADVIKGQCDYNSILVYDVSRWGRFQDADESAHYEFICRKAGVQVIYCAEAFENDGSPFSGIVKGLKRIMAAEYSRELSQKVFDGQANIVRKGFRAGARAGYGLRRVLVDANGTEKKEELKFGDRKNIQTDRVVLRPGPADEVRTVWDIYRWFVDERLMYVDIIKRLEASGIPPPAGVQRWSKHVLRTILSSEKYVGNLVYNRTSNRLKKHFVREHESKWIRYENAFPGIVDRVTFERARDLVASNPKRKSEEELLTKLRGLYQAKGHLSHALLSQTPGMPSVDCYRAHFGSTEKAFELVGFKHCYDYVQLGRKAYATRQRLKPLLERCVHDLRWQGEPVKRIAELRIRIRSYDLTFVAWRFQPVRKTWRFVVEEPCALVVAVRLDTPEAECFVFERTSFARKGLCLRDECFYAKLGGGLTAECDLSLYLVSAATSLAHRSNQRPRECR